MNSNFIYALYINDPDHDNGKAVKFDTVEAAIKAAQDAVHDDPFYTDAEIMKIDANMNDVWESYITFTSNGDAFADTADAQRETGWAPYALYINGEDNDYDADMADWFYDFDSALDAGCEALLEDEDAQVRIMKFDSELNCKWSYYRDVTDGEAAEYQARRYKQQKLGDEKKVTLQTAQEMMEDNDGNLDLSRTDITELPDGLSVPGCLNLRDSKVTSLPDGLTVGGGLRMSGVRITALPDNLTVGRYLDLSDLPITSLPDGLTVGGNLYLEGSSITSLPDNLTVGGDLHLVRSSVTSLPDNLTVGGCLFMQRTGIKELPDSLKAGLIFR